MNPVLRDAKDSIPLIKTGVKVLADLAERPLAGWDVHLVSPYRRQIYSGMLPGWVAGHYPLEACAISLDQLAARGAVAFHETAGTALDLTGQSLQCADGSTLRYDALSIDTGPMPSLADLPGAAEHALPVRPIERFIAAWPAVVERIANQCRRFDLVVLGAENKSFVERLYLGQHIEAAITEVPCATLIVIPRVTARR